MGTPHDGTNLDRRLPITGVVEGVVYVLTAAGREPAPNVAINLETGRSAITDQQGRYSFATVPEGAHIASIDLERLPADFNPGPIVRIPVAIGARKIARGDFQLYSLTGFSGQVMAAPGSEFETLEGIAIGLEPGGRYTTTARDGSFAFYNLPEGMYQVEVASASLPPPQSMLKDESAIPVAIRTGATTQARAVRDSTATAGGKTRASYDRQSAWTSLFRAACKIASRHSFSPDRRKAACCTMQLTKALARPMRRVEEPQVSAVHRAGAILIVVAALWPAAKLVRSGRVLRTC